MNPKLRAFARWAVWALPIWAVLLFLGTLTHQPDPKTDYGAFAAYVTTTRFLVSHIAASIVGAALGSIGLIALLLHLQEARGVGRLAIGTIAMVTANTMTSSIFGVAAFAQPAMGRAFQAGRPGMLDFYNDVYGNKLFGLAAAALLLFMAGAVLLGSGLTASRQVPRWTGWVFAVTAIVFVLSNFLVPVGQSAASALLFAATTVIAWKTFSDETARHLRSVSEAQDTISRAA